MAIKRKQDNLEKGFDARGRSTEKGRVGGDCCSLMGGPFSPGKRTRPTLGSNL